jgi:hypothetical protein
MNTIPGINEVGPYTEAEMRFETMPLEVRARILAQHCQRLMDLNEILAAENTILRNHNARLKLDKLHKVQEMAAMQRDVEKLRKDLAMYRRFVRSNSGQGMFNLYCRLNAANSNSQ